MRRAARWLAAGGTAAVAAAVLGWAARPARLPDPPEPTEAVPHPPARIPPGTVIADGPPAGWSHLVSKALPRVRSTERGKVNAYTARMAEWMFTAFLADVRPDPPRLRAIALGLGCRIDGRDTIVTPDTGERFGADLGLVTRSILAKGYERQATAAVVGRTPTFAVIDTPLWYRLGGTHRLVRFRHALLAGDGGSLETLVWVVGPDGGAVDPPAVVRLAPSTIDEAELVIDANEITLGVPSEAAFAVDRLPPGRPLGGLPGDLRGPACRAVFPPDEAAELERELRRWAAMP
jgi:hypothetical protein